MRRHSRESRESLRAEILTGWEAASREQAASLDGSGAAVDALYERGMQANKDGDTDKALQHFLQALDLSPLDPKVLLSAGNMQLKLGQLRAARAQYDKVPPRPPWIGYRPGVSWRMDTRRRTPYHAPRRCATDR